MAEDKERDPVNVITVEAYQSGAIGEITNILKLIEKNRDKLTLETLEEVLNKRLKQLK